MIRAMTAPLKRPHRPSDNLKSHNTESECQLPLRDISCEEEFTEGVTGTFIMYKSIDIHELIHMTNNYTLATRSSNAPWRQTRMNKPYMKCHNESRLF